MHIYDGGSLTAVVIKLIIKELQKITSTQVLTPLVISEYSTHSKEAEAETEAKRE